jgi:hypothetical protein
MTRSEQRGIGRSAERLLEALASDGFTPSKRSAREAKRPASDEAAVLIAADLAVYERDGRLRITQAGRAHLARLALGRGASPIGPFRAQHLALAEQPLARDDRRTNVLVDQAESPLAWLARRKGRDGRALIELVQLQAGDRLRADFTRAQLTPRVTASWTSSVAQGRRGGVTASPTFTEAAVAARQRVRQALDAVGPEFTGLLLDVCCFLKGLEDVERERRWPPRSAKVVLQLGLDRLARHYGYASEARGRSRTPVRTWLAPDAAFTADRE